MLPRSWASVFRTTNTANPCKMADPHLWTNHVHTFVLLAYTETVALIPCAMSVSSLLPPHSSRLMKICLIALYFVFIYQTVYICHLFSWTRPRAWQILRECRKATWTGSLCPSQPQAPSKQEQPLSNAGSQNLWGQPSLRLYFTK